MTDASHGKQFATRMNEDIRLALLAQQTECTFVWQGDSGACGTIMSFLWADNCLWLTTNDSRPRVNAVRKHGNATAVISSAGTALGQSRCITLRGQCHVIDDRQTAAWFYPLFCQKLFPDNPRAQTAMQNLLDRDGQVILQLRPEKIVAYDGNALMEKLAAL